MLKLVDLDSSFFNDEPIIKIIDPAANSGSFKGMTKSAADSRVSIFAADIKPDPNRIYIHILAMGAGEFFGANRNADFFPEENLIKYHDTFVSSPAHIFKHHINKNPEIAIGQVIYSVYNERMHRVELVAWIDKKRGWDVVERIERGEFPTTSMACHTPFDTCSVCGNRARSRNEYCTHLRNELGKVYPDGKKVMAINDGALKFFDQSIVFKPADVTSSVLQKLAYATSSDFQPVLGSAESADLIGLQEKSANITKLSDLIKEVEGTTVAASGSVNTLLDRVKDPNDKVLDILAGFELDHVIHALAQLGVSPSVGFFARLIGQKLTGSSVDGIEVLVKGLIAEEPGNLPVSTGEMTKTANESQVQSLARTLRPMVKASSLFPDSILSAGHTENAAAGHPEYDLFENSHHAPVVSTGNVGYVGNGPHPVPDPRASYRALQAAIKRKELDSPGLLRTLFMIGGAAITAKWLISKMIESKMQEERARMAEKSPEQIKIVLVKSAEEAFTTQQLVKASLIRNLNGL